MDLNNLCTSNFINKSSNYSNPNNNNNNIFTERKFANDESSDKVHSKNLHYNSMLLQNSIFTNKTMANGATIAKISDNSQTKNSGRSTRGQIKKPPNGQTSLKSKAANQISIHNNTVSNNNNNSQTNCNKNEISTNTIIVDRLSKSSHDSLQDP